MEKQIQAYFRTEDEAEGARSSLQAYRTEHLEVGALDDALGRDTRVLIPMLPYNNTGTAGAAIPVAGAYSENIIPEAENGEADRGTARRDLNEDRSGTTDHDTGLLHATDVYINGDQDELRYVLSAKVNDADYDEVVHKLRSNRGYVAQLD
ncbi:MULTISPECIES: hypothetical protein [unclassified Paenibacillus]|uniref:hypothetical protein n=1 Tax=unclassified Paenibacillus TaxID=185978 RepID=UPI0024B9A9A4|nr:MULTISPECIES: hypothetical protein [unclassified Paenibacillus]